MGPEAGGRAGHARGADRRRRDRPARGHRRPASTSSGMTRALMADPDLAVKVAAGHADRDPTVRRREHLPRQHLQHRARRSASTTPRPVGSWCCRSGSSGPPRRSVASSSAVVRPGSRPRACSAERGHAVTPVRGELDVRRARSRSRHRRAPPRPHRHHRLAGRRMPSGSASTCTATTTSSPTRSPRGRGHRGHRRAARAPRSGFPATISRWTAGTCSRARSPDR